MLHLEHTGLFVKLYTALNTARVCACVCIDGIFSVLGTENSYTIHGRVTSLLLACLLNTSTSVAFCTCCLFVS